MKFNRADISKAIVALLAIFSLFALVSCEHEHEMGEWKSFNETEHSRYCQKKNCEYMEVEKHTFGEGVVISEPTVEKDGQTDFSCTVCGYKYSETTQVEVGIKLQEFEEWDIHSSLQMKYLADKVENAVNYAKGTAELSYPRTRTFNWEVYNVKDDNKPSVYTFRIGEKEDLSDAKEITTKFNDYSESNGGMNFKVRTKYYWQVTATLQDGREIASNISSFTTLEGPRNIYVEGVANFRDLGGKDCDGGVLRQNLIFRCGRLHENYSYTQKINDKGITRLLNMGIKTEIDLRGKIKDGIIENGSKVDKSFTVTKSVLGDSVKYFHCGAEYSDSMLGTNVGKTMVKQTFEVLADKDNYPLLFHCSIGTDRTGIIAILTEGVCGVAEETVKQDYFFSNFGNIGSTREISRYNTVVAPIKAKKGANFMEKCNAYLLSCGVTQAQIDSVREILIEKN